MEEKSTCPFCGQSHPLKARFCPITGQELFRLTSKETTLGTDADVSLPPPSTGLLANQSKVTDHFFCPKCGASLPKTARFCPICRTRLVFPKVHPQQPDLAESRLIRLRRIYLWIIALGIVVFFLGVVVISTSLFFPYQFKNFVGIKLTKSTGVAFIATPTSIGTSDFIHPIIPASNNSPTLALNLTQSANFTPTTIFSPTKAILSIPTELVSQSPHPHVTTMRNPAPSAYNYSTCAQPCNGSNATSVFAEGVKEIFAQWNYQNIPVGAKYTRFWTMNGQEWVRYSCIWPGPQTGLDKVSLSEPKGLHSGTWQMTIIVNGQVILKGRIQVEGNWNYWSPAGNFDTCYGKR